MTGEVARHKDRDIDGVVAAWQRFLRTAVWQKLVEGVEPKQTGCGPIYELPNPIDRPNESFAIADMRNLPFAAPHYHANGEVEIYFGLQGSGTVVTGGVPQRFGQGDVIVTPPETAHFTLPESDLVLAVVNTPPFNPNNAVNLTESKPSVRFDQTQFEELTAGR
jgi:mannose-6-phosphate isomerase-like protein (cupin superfamily)